ncbi:MAG: YcjF family protein, partial [Hyphomicrobiaceae bacterium]
RPAFARLSGYGRWGTIFAGALGGLVTLAAGLWLVDFLSLALQRSDWIGTLAWVLMALAALSALAMVLREVVGLVRLARLTHLRSDAQNALQSRDLKAERAIVARLRAALSGRLDLSWSLSRFREHEGDVRDPGDLLALADRELMAPLDAEARRLILSSAKRVSVVTALSPIALISVGFVALENLRLLRAVATLYGARPGYLGGFRLARMVLGHIAATGSIALTDDLIGQFIGHDLVRRLSRRLGEGLFNGALTARIGAAAVEVTRPLPFVEAPPVRARDMIGEFVRRNRMPKSKAS